MGCIKPKQVISKESKTKGIIDISCSNNMTCQIKAKQEQLHRLSIASNNIHINNIFTQKKTKPEDNYKVICKIGKGSFGSVYKVIQNISGIIRAMKVIKKEMINYQDDEKIFLKEIEILTKLEHPNIIKIIEYYADDINYYLITEYVSGGELYETITKCDRFDELKAAEIIKQLLCSLNYLHSNGIVHRDIKPENILVEKNSSDDNDSINIKLIDFGTSNYVWDNNYLTLRVGSPYYIAPEVLKKSYNKKCDIWSAGVILYITLLGYPPFKGKNMEDLFSKIITGIYCKTGSNWDKLSINAKDLIQNMIEYDPEKRFSAQQCLDHPWFSNDKENETVMVNLLPSIMTNLCHLNAREKLQEATIAYIVHTLSSNREIENLKKAFQVLDLNDDGKLTYSEMKIAFENYFGKSISEMKMNKIIEEMDGNSDGIISYEEFLRVAINQKHILEEDNLQCAFKGFDTNNDGKLSKEELKVVLGTTDLEYINILLDLIDENKDGYLSYDEFKSLMNNLIISHEENADYFALKYKQTFFSHAKTAEMTNPTTYVFNKKGTMQ